jgi:beta-glucosidase
VQLCIRDLIASITMPVKELKFFELIQLQANGTKRVEFTIDQKAIEFFTANLKWEAKLADFNVFIGEGSAASL